MRRRECSLLPHIKEKVYGLTTRSLQFFPWPVTKFNVQSAWRYSEGEEVTVAVIDTGCDIDHEDLKDNLIDGYNAIDGTKDVNDINGHGSHVAGTIAAINNGIGMIGTAPKTKIMPIKALGDDGSGNNLTIANAVKWAVDNGADLITMSLGSPYASRHLEKALDYAERNSVVVFCAAGNSGNNVDIMYPAKFLTTISIGAIDHNLKICNFSCCGDGLDFLSPGEDILSTTPENTYSKMSGTSMATPFAVGCASLLLSLKRKDNKSLILSREEYIEEFSKVAIKLKDPKHRGDKRYEGNGILTPVVL